MAQSIIDALFYGKIIPHEQIGVTDNDEYDEVNRFIREEKEYLSGKLTEQDRQRLEAFEVLFTQSSSIQNIEAFHYGFRLGVMLMADVFAGKDLLVSKTAPSDKPE